MMNWLKELFAEKHELLDRYLEFEDVEIGDIFCTKGCIDIMLKTGDKTYILVSDDWSRIIYAGVENEMKDLSLTVRTPTKHLLDIVYGRI